MRLVVQRCSRASVSVGGRQVGAVGDGLVVLVGVAPTDSGEDVAYAVDKVVNLRIFEDSDGKMNHSLLDVHGQILSVSQFTLYGDVRKGRRPNFMGAARPPHAEAMYEAFNKQLRSYGITVATGVFGAMMEVSLVNDGPVTILLDSQRTF